MNITNQLTSLAGDIPDAPAIITGEGSLSFLELEMALSWTVAAFQRAGLAPGDIVGIDLPDQIQHLLTALALARLGAGQISLQPSDAPQLLARLSGSLNITAIVAGTGATGDLSIIEPPPARLGELKQLKSHPVQAAEDGALPFLIMITSGTEGIPKACAVIHSHAAIRLGLSSHAQPSGPGCRFLSLTDMGFNGPKCRVFHALSSGGCLAFPENRRAAPLTEFIIKHRVNYLAGTSIHAARLLAKSEKNHIRFPDVDALRISSTLVPERLRQRIREQLSPNLYIGFGTTETGTVALASPSLVRRVPGVVGKTVPGVHAEVIDDNNMPLPPGEVGRLRVKSRGLVQGYIGAPEISARVFRDGWFYGADLAELTPGGELIHHGRADDMLIFDGVNIYPAEIEAVLLKHPRIAEAAAFSLPSDHHGDSPAAAIVSASPLSEQELFDYCRPRLGSRAPKRFLLVHALPKNAAGKISRIALRELAEPSKPDIAGELT